MTSKLTYIKLHYFFMMAAYGPILPQLPLFGKDLGVSSTVIGAVIGILPLTFVLTKPLFGMLIDIHRKHRKTIFLSLIIGVTLAVAVLFYVRQLNSDTRIYATNTTFFDNCTENVSVTCNSACFPQPVAMILRKNRDEICWPRLSDDFRCDLICTETSSGRYQSFTLWSVIILLSVVTIGFDLVNSMSDTICFELVENEDHYGNQRLWGSIGFGLTGLISGFAVSLFSADSLNYSPALITMIIFTVFDLFVCFKLQLPDVPPPKNIFQDLKLMQNKKSVLIFLTFAVFAGSFTSLINTFFFWYLEDLAIETDTHNIKLIEGLILAAENLSAEVIFFSVSGNILKRLGHVHSFTCCFFTYAVRLGLIAMIPTPWWALTFELFMQGPTYALTYTAIMTYAKDLAPVGMSATTQGLAAGFSDGIGFACGSVGAGVLFKYFGGRTTFLIFTGIASICGVLHCILYKFLSKCANNRGYEAI